MTIPAQNTDLANSIKQFYQEQKQSGIDSAYLEQMIQQMVALCKAGKADEAFNIAQRDVMPGAMQVQGDSMGRLASQMNISSAYQEFATGIQNAVNSASMTDGASSPDNVTLINNMCDVWNNVTHEMTLPQNQQWMDQKGNTAQNILDSISQICKVLNPKDPTGNPNNLDPDDSYTLTIATWEAKPSANGSNTGNTQNIQDLQSGLTQLNNSVSAQSQGLQAEEQFAANTFTQYMNACKDVFQSSQNQIQAIVQNQKTQ